MIAEAALQTMHSTFLLIACLNLDNVLIASELDIVKFGQLKQYFK